MDPISAANDVQSTKALAHKLYCQCQIPNSPYRPLARSVRSVRNKLEEADDALNEVALGPEEIRVLYAVEASKNVLDKLDHTLQRSNLDAVAYEDIPIHYYIDAFANWIDVALKELSDAVESLERSTGRPIDMPSNTPMNTPSAQPTPVDTPTSLSSSHQWHTPARRSDFDCSSSLTDATSIHSFGAGSVASASRDMLTRSIGKKIQPGLNDTPKMSSNNTTDSWRSPFASPDPMSIDIDAASSMILNEKPVKEMCFPQAKETQSIISLPVSTRASEAPEAVAPSSPSDDHVQESNLAIFVQSPTELDTTSHSTPQKYTPPIIPQPEPSTLVTTTTAAANKPSLLDRTISSSPQIPRKKPPLLSTSIITCQDFPWLITTSREFLDKFGFSYTEHSDEKKKITWIECSNEQSLMMMKIVFFRCMFRSGFGVKVCVQQQQQQQQQQSVVVVEEEVKKMKRRMKEFLERELMKHEARRLEGIVMPVMSANGGGIYRRVSVSGKSRGFVGSSASGSSGGSLI